MVDVSLSEFTFLLVGVDDGGVVGVISGNPDLGCSFSVKLAIVVANSLVGILLFEFGLIGVLSIESSLGWIVESAFDVRSVLTVAIFLY